MLGRELEGRANKLVRESKERAEKAKRQAEKEKLLRQRQEERQRQFEEQKRQQRLAEQAAVEAVSISSFSLTQYASSRLYRLCDAV